ncbi:MAG: hypothetical protein ACFBSE_22400 [Prochloraceae cyanobacterium]
MKLDLKNLIISELTCQEWKAHKTIAKSELSPAEEYLGASCKIELSSRSAMPTQDYHSNN